jgi:hypothetical protein
MKKHGPPPCGMNRVGSLLIAFTREFSGALEPSRVICERQFNAAAISGDPINFKR